eukprot:1150959-Alexandrium_andersonii.AAC.1
MRNFGQESQGYFAPGIGREPQDSPFCGQRFISEPQGHAARRFCHVSGPLRAERQPRVPGPFRKPPFRAG